MGGPVAPILETTACPSGPFFEGLSVPSIQQSFWILYVSRCGVKRYREPRRTEIFLGEPGKALKRTENFLILENEGEGEWAGTMEQLSSVFKGQSQHGLARWWLQSSDSGLRGCNVER